MASVPVSEEGRSPPDTPAEQQQQQQWQGKAKRAQVKNACNNCQRACKRCDSGRPCQRCVKYNMADTCVDSKRKPRKKGIKRGPYKKRKRNTSHDDDSQSNATSSLTETTTNTNTTNTTSTAPPPPPPGSRRSGSGVGIGVGIGRRAAAETAHGRPRRPHRPRPPQILGPGAIAILHADPAADDGGDDDGAGAGAGRSSDSGSSGSGSGSDTPLVQHRRAAFPQHGGGAFHQQHHQQPETPTMGLTAAFNTLATVHRQHYHHHHPAQLPPASSAAATSSSSRPPLQYSQPPAYHHALPPLPFMRGAGPVRLPPIESFDHAQPQPQPQPQSRPPSSLAMLTDVALRRSPPSLHAMPQQDPQNQNQQNPQNPQNMSRRHQHGRQRTASDAVEQQSLLDVPEDPHNSSRHTTSAESDMSSVPSSFDSRQSLHHRFSNDNLTRAHIRRLSRRLHDTHLEQEYADKEDESAWLPDADYDDDDDDDDDAPADFADSALSC
ncbi:hypothetical protein LPJ72_000513 [Coemansia sp. Benny D160-2]|nr:hypothetical protein LPJ72_000513 [Coemansia sp. Benny D160-2]